MATTKIVSRFDGRTLYECDAESRLAALERAVKSGANLSASDLSGADLPGADLSWAKLGGAKLNWKSHTLIAELLRRAAGEDVQKRMVAGLVVMSPDWCWDEFLAIDHELRGWALDTLREYVIDGDDAPEILRKQEDEEEDEEENDDEEEN